MKLELPEYINAVIDTLEENGYEAYAVGGCVRDMLMDRIPHDFDVCTSALPSEIKSCFDGEKIVPTGEKHGTVTLIGEEPIEITTFRTDGDYTDGRHPDSVTFIRSIEGDLARRDFTVNAMAYSEKRGLIDLYGGTDDLKKGVIRCVGEPGARFHEDALRILRALRFASVYGFSIEDKTSDAIHSCRELLRNISAERINSEMTKLLCGKDAAKILRHYADVISVFIPEILPAIAFEQHSVHHHLDVWEHTLAVLDASENIPLMRWISLLHDLGKPDCCVIDEHGCKHFWGHPALGEKMARDILKRLKNDNRTVDAVCNVIKHHDDYFVGGRIEMRKYIARLGKDTADLVLRFRVFDTKGQSPDTREQKLADLKRARELYDSVIRDGDCTSVSDLAVNGSDLIAAGIPEGKEIKNALSFLLDAVMSDQCRNDRDELINYVKGHKN